MNEADWQMTGNKLGMIIHKNCISKSLVIIDRRLVND